MWRGNCFHCPRASRTEYNKVAWGGQTSTTLYNILQSKRHVVSYNICSVKKFDSDQTLYNKIQHDTIRYNKMVKRVQHFIQHQSCMMLYEMLYSFGRGLIDVIHLPRKVIEHIPSADSLFRSDKQPELNLENAYPDKTENNLKTNSSTSIL